MIFSVVGWLIPFYDEAKVGFIVFLGALSLSLSLSLSVCLSLSLPLSLSLSLARSLGLSRTLNTSTVRAHSN